MFGLDKLLRTGTGMEKRYGPVTVHGLPLRCLVCRHDEFREHPVQLHTPAATFFNVEFANRIASCAVCASCGHVHFFVPSDMAPDDSSEGKPSPWRTEAGALATSRARLAPRLG